MNSRDAAFDESLKEIIEATAAEAAAVQDTSADDISIPVPDINDNGKKKRKRTEDDRSVEPRFISQTNINTPSVVRKREHAPQAQHQMAKEAQHLHSNHHRPTRLLQHPNLPELEIKEEAERPRRLKQRQQNQKKVNITSSEFDPSSNNPFIYIAFNASTKRPGQASRAKGSNAPKRPPLSQSISQGSGAATHDHGTRRNQSGTGTGQQGTSAADARAYRNSHAYAVSQQTLFTSWNLPDYLSHLEQMLPTDVPQPLEVRAGAPSGSSSTRGESAERTMERGVKVKWPAKRMSVGDMNKRVRALVEWVGREQASALDRGRRREALEKSLREQPDATPAEPTGSSEDVAAPTDADAAMLVDDNPLAPEPQNLPTKTTIESNLMSESALEMSSQTMKMMEELMEELIGFQERFGPGAKTRDRERRLAA